LLYAKIFTYDITENKDKKKQLPLYILLVADITYNYATYF